MGGLGPVSVRRCCIEKLDIWDFLMEWGFGEFFFLWLRQGSADF
jgi:hypothetical protein